MPKYLVFYFNSQTLEEMRFITSFQRHHFRLWPEWHHWRINRLEKKYPEWIFFEVAKIRRWKQRPKRDANISYWFYIYTFTQISTHYWNYKWVYVFNPPPFSNRTSFDTWLNLLSFARGEQILTKIYQDMKDEGQPQNKWGKIRGKEF